MAVSDPGKMKLDCLKAARRCFKSTKALVTECRNSFEIWFALHDFKDRDNAGSAHNAYDPIFKSTMDAHFLVLVINLFILGDEDSKRRQNMSLYFLGRKLAGAGLISHVESEKWEATLKKANFHHERIKLIRDKYYAHRDKNYTWDKAMHEANIHVQVLDGIIAIYYDYVSAAAKCLKEKCASHADVATTIKESVADIKSQLGELLPYGNSSIWKSRALRLQKIETNMTV